MIIVAAACVLKRLDDSADVRKGIWIKPSVPMDPSLLVILGAPPSRKSGLIETGKVSEGSLGNGDQWMEEGCDPSRKECDARKISPPPLSIPLEGTKDVFLFFSSTMS